jgi:hypothetical protein
MRLPSQNADGNGSVPAIPEEQGEFPMLDDLALPESATTEASRPSLTRIDTDAANGELTPRMAARKTPKLGPLSTPGTARATPLASAVTSPVSGMASPVTSRRPELKSRNSKKRGSVSHALVSPALRPRISPSIRPLVPEGATSTEDQHTQFLASRSNYQNLIDNTHLPGVSYPADLPTQLTSKRTSHKIAEQGRRQRINTALTEMNKLLPKESPVIGAKNDDYDDDEDDDDFKKGGGGKGGGNSKAATVEAAIRYIHSLKKDDAEKAEALSKAAKDMEELKKKLAALEKKCGSEAKAEGTNE